MARTLIGPETRVAGPLSGNDDLQVEGTVEGPVEGGAQVVIAAGARVHGEVRGRDVIVGGALSFNVYATGSVRLLASAEVRADIECPRIAIDEGALFEGQVRMRAPATKAAPTTAPAPPAAPVAPAPTTAPVAPAPPAARATPAPRPVAPAAAPRPVAKAPPLAAHREHAPAPQPRVEPAEREIPSLPALGKRKLVRRTP